MGIFSAPEPKQVDVLGKAIKCLVCGHDRFHQREAQLNTAGLTLLKLDWMNSSGLCAVCDQCGFIHWFLPK